MYGPLSLQRKVKAVLSGGCAGACLAILVLIMISSGPSVMADDWVPPGLCTSGAVIVTSFAPDLHC
jgi:hypothetical protein